MPQVSENYPSLYDNPPTAAEETLKTGFTHLKESYPATFVKSLFGGIELSISGLLALVLLSGVKEGCENAGLVVVPQVLMGVVFPLGLVVVYMTGSELYTGYPMWYTLTFLSYLTSPRRYGRLTPHVLLAHFLGPFTSWLGNLVGALLVASLLSITTGTITSSPYASGVSELISSELVETPWGTIFASAIGCGFSVTLAMYLGEVAHETLGRAFGLWLPFAICTALKWPHTVEYMYIGSLGLLGSSYGLRPEGYNLGTYIWKGLLPISLGNAIGGAVGMGGYLWLVYLWDAEKKKEAMRWRNEEDGGEYDEE